MVPAKEVGRYIFHGDGGSSSSGSNTVKREPKTPLSRYDPDRSPYAKQPPVFGSFNTDNADVLVSNSIGKGTHISLGDSQPRSLKPSDWLKSQTLKDPALTPHETGAKEVTKLNQRTKITGLLFLPGFVVAYEALAGNQRWIGLRRGLQPRPGLGRPLEPGKALRPLVLTLPPP